LEEKRKNALDQFNFKKKELEGEKNTTRKKRLNTDMEGLKEKIEEFDKKIKELDESFTIDN